MAYKIITPAQMKQAWEEFNNFAHVKAYAKLPYDEWKIYNKLITKIKIDYGYNYIIEYLPQEKCIYVGFPQEYGSAYISKPLHIFSSFGQYLYTTIIDNDNYECYGSRYSKDDNYSWETVTVDLNSIGYHKRFPYGDITFTSKDNLTAINHLNTSVGASAITDNNALINLTVTPDGYYTRNTTGDYYGPIASTTAGWKPDYTTTQLPIDTIVNNKEKEDKNMFNFDFGPVNGDSIRLSPYGLAVKNIDGKYATYDKNSNSIVDVDVFNFDCQRFVYKMPVAIADIRVGDIVIHHKKPMYVKEIFTLDKSLNVVDVFSGENKNIMLTRNMFGFDFATKVVNLIDTFGNGATAANESNPFGNMLPFFLMSDNKDIDPMMLLLMSNNGNMMNNPMMMYALMSNDSKSKDMLPFLMMANTCSCSCHCGDSEKK